MTLGSKLKKKRLELNLTQADVANKLFVSPQTISRWELDQSLPSIFFVLEISSLYNISLDYLLKGDESVKKSYKNKDTVTKVLAACLIFLYLILFSYLIITNVNKNIKSVPVSEIKTTNYSTEIDHNYSLQIQFNRRNIEGITSEYSDGNLYIVVLYKPIKLFNSIDVMDLPLNELIKTHNIGYEDIDKITLVQFEKENYNQNIQLKDLSTKKEIYKRKKLD